MMRGVMTKIVEAARERGWVAPPKGFWSLTPEAFGLHAHPPTISVDVGPWVSRKVAAMLCHHSQMIDRHPLGDLGEDVAKQCFGLEYFHRADIPTKGLPVLEQL
jgi:LmbE family N-acetylglucosaminyl deacetylase